MREPRGRASVGAAALAARALGEQLERDAFDHQSGD
jgi:hypothetical protein